MRERIEYAILITFPIWFVLGFIALMELTGADG